MKSRPALIDIAAVLPTVLALLIRLKWRHKRMGIYALAATVVHGAGNRRMRLDRAQVAARLAGAIIRRLPRLFPQYCLYWSLAACHFLTRAGLSPVIHIGVRMEEGDLVSHAWVTVDGEVVAGQSDPGDFTEMLTLP